MAMLAAVTFGSTLARGDTRWRELFATLTSGENPPPIARPVAARARTEPEPTYPPVEEVGALWGCSWPLLDDEVSPVGDIHKALRRRGWEPAMVAHRDLVRVMRPGELPGWAPRSALDVHRLVVQMFDARGVRRSLRFRALVSDARPSKALPPTGYAMGGLVMADPMAQAILRGSLGWMRTCWDHRIVVAEGEPDFLTWAARDDRWVQEQDTGVGYGVFGIVSGSWTQAIANRIPTGTTVIIRTDHDPQGEKYAQIISSSLFTRCRIVRSQSMELE